jgi:hypothetical protein
MTLFLWALVEGLSLFALWMALFWKHFVTQEKFAFMMSGPTLDSDVKREDGHLLDLNYPQKSLSSIMV